LVADRDAAAVKFDLQRAIRKIRPNGIKSELLGEVFSSIARCEYCPQLYFTILLLGQTVKVINVRSF